MSKNYLSFHIRMMQLYRRNKNVTEITILGLALLQNFTEIPKSGIASFSS
jgi:hypothetical protein